MEFRTIVTPRPTDIRIDHHTAILMLGSCFTDNIGCRLAQRNFRVAANPLGTLYNPASIAAVARLIASGRTVGPDELFEHLGVWRHPLCHGSLARPSRADTLNEINTMLQNVRNLLAGSSRSVLFVTLGTARVYERQGIVVANCHKLPASEFTRRMMSPKECADHIRQAVDDLRRLSPSLRVVLTVSPIRHKEAGLDGNSVSKAALLLACNELTDDFTAQDCYYFPSYEMLIDDLRDYRFYADDMRHPSAVAVDYIFEAVEQTFMSDITKRAAADFLALSRLATHKVLSADPEAQDSHNQKIIEKRRQLAALYPDITISV